MGNRKEAASLESKVTVLMDLRNSVSANETEEPEGSVGAVAHHRKCDSHLR